MLLLLHLFHYSASFLLFLCLRLDTSNFIFHFHFSHSCFLLHSFPILPPTSVAYSFSPYFSLFFHSSQPTIVEGTIPPLSLPLQARPWSGIRSPSSLLDRELRRLGFGTSAPLTAGTENRCHFRCQLPADEQQLPGGTDLLRGSCWADTECRLLAGVKL